jgi:hypothetical protein
MKMKKMNTTVQIAALTSSFVLCIGSLGQQPPPIPRQTYPVAAAHDDSGYEMIFDGKTLHGWDGKNDPKYWRVENGSLVGEVTPETLLKQNSFIIWRGGSTKDFELKVEYRISANGNSGINYRTVEVPGEPWAMRGYQAGRYRRPEPVHRPELGGPRPHLRCPERPDHTHPHRQESRGHWFARRRERAGVVHVGPPMKIEYRNFRILPK